MKYNNKPVKMTLAHINDTHSYFEPQSLQLKLTIEQREISPFVSNGGFARIAARAKQLKLRAKKEEREFMFFHAGDCFQGTLYFSLFKGKANADMLNALEIDAMALGNHELDMGNQPVAEFLTRVNFPLMSGNWDLSEESKSKPLKLNEQSNLYAFDEKSQAARYMVKNVDDEPVAIFGISMDQMAEISNPDPDTPFVNVLETVNRTVESLHKRGINKIILLSHLGFEADRKLAQATSGISLIIGGHSHTLMGDFSPIGLESQPEYGIQVNDTRIVQSGLHSQALGHCDIDFNADGSIAEFNGKNELLIGRRLCIDASLTSEHGDALHQQAADFLAQQANVVVCKKDPYVHSLLNDKYIPKVRKLQQTIIAEITSPLRHVRIPDEQGPSELVPLVAEAFYHSMKAQGHDVDFALHNAGGIRTSLNPGEVSVADIAGKLLPFAVPIGVYQLKGKHLALALEGAINNATNNGVIGTGSGSYPYTYNLDFRYLKDNPAGQRLKDLKIYREGEGWVEVQGEKVYVGTSSAYTMKGKEGYSAITNMLGNGSITNLSMSDCFVDFLKRFPERLDGISQAKLKLLG